MNQFLRKHEATEPATEPTMSRLPMNIIDICTEEWNPQLFTLPSFIQSCSLAHTTFKDLGTDTLPTNLDPRYELYTYTYFIYMNISQHE